MLSGLADVEHCLLWMLLWVLWQHLQGCPAYSPWMQENKPLFPVVSNGHLLSLCGSRFTHIHFPPKSLHLLGGHLRLN